MCGIAGFCNGPKDWQKAIRGMNDCMARRGPDGSGIWADEAAGVVLGHRRLSVVDLRESGAQPMELNNRRYVITYNGEIYNHRTLRQQLLDEGKVTGFRGTSDTEVLLEAINAWGLTETLAKCKGMFAFALYDEKERTLSLTRDRVGEKPLYYGFLGNGGQQTFAFASDIRAISSLEGFHNPIYREILDAYLRYGYVPAPYTIYEGIYKLMPGQILTMKAPFRPQDMQTRTYWSMQDMACRGQADPFTGSEEEAARELERLLQDALREQMLADVPVGAFLSSGIDSSTVVALLQSVSDRPVRTFTIGMDDPAFNEAEYAAQIAERLGTSHTELYITEQDALDVIPKLPDMFGEPFADSSQIPTYLVSRMTRDHVTVSLSGDAGDELVGGYRTYLSLQRIWGKNTRIPTPLRKCASGLLLHTPMGKRGDLAVRARLLGASSIEDLYRRSAQGEHLQLLASETGTLQSDGSSARLSGGSGTLQSPPGTEEADARIWMDKYPAGLLSEPVQNIMLMDLLQYHPDDILTKVDRTAMAVSLETRIPLLDRDVVEFSFRLPLAYKMSDGVTKRVLRDILYRYVPREWMERPKKGFSIPLHHWLRDGALKEWAESLIEPSKLRAQGFFDPKAVTRMWQDLQENGTWRTQIWHVLMFQAFLENAGKACASAGAQAVHEV